MKVIFKGKECLIEKKRFYLKAGEYEHKHRTGWVLLNADRKVILGDTIYCPNRNLGAARYEYPEFKTRKELLWHINEINKYEEAKKLKG